MHNGNINSYVQYMLYVLTSWSKGNTFVSGAESLRFKCRAINFEVNLAAKKQVVGCFVEA